MFRVVPDQLRISGGWVRCGNCDEVFDANTSLRPAAVPTPVVSPPPPPITPAPPVFSLPAQEPEPEPDSQDQVLPAIALRIPHEDPFLALRPSEHAEQEPVSVAEELNISALGDVVPATVNRDDTPRYVQSEPSAPVVDEPSFMRKRPQRTRKQGRVAKWLALVVCLLGGTALVVQVLRHERNYIAAVHPATAPVLVALCDALGCELGPLRQIESLLIDSSAFAKVRADTYRLSFTLRNSAPQAVAVPAVELTLTDNLDQSVLRRVLQVSDFAPGQTNIAAGGELAVNLPLSIQVGGAVQKFSGYRLLAFYP